MATINSFADLQKYLDNFLQNNSEWPVGPPHRDFWNTMSYNDFTTGNVPGVNPPVRILVVGNGLQSNLVQALMGVGQLFDPNSGTYGQMPANGPPFMQPAGPTPGPLVQPIIDWINNGCPE
jgi:hypothetical protein